MAFSFSSVPRPPVRVEIVFPLEEVVSTFLSRRIARSSRRVRKWHLFVVANGDLRFVRRGRLSATVTNKLEIDRCIWRMHLAGYLSTRHLQSIIYPCVLFFPLFLLDVHYREILYQYFDSFQSLFIAIKFHQLDLILYRVNKDV